MKHNASCADCGRNVTMWFTANKNVALSASTIIAQQLAKPTNSPALGPMLLGGDYFWASGAKVFDHFERSEL